jgi:hypothetical protein
MNNHQLSLLKNLRFLCWLLFNKARAIKNMNKASSITVLAFISAILSVEGANNMKAFSPAEKGMVRHVLQLPKQDDESAFKLELIVGKTVQHEHPHRRPHECPSARIELGPAGGQL